MERSGAHKPGAKKNQKASTGKRPRKISEYGKQLDEKQRVKRSYGLREKQFYRFFASAVRMEGAPGHNLLSLLERRLDNVIYRLKLASSRAQARQIVVHGHIRLNGKKAHSPSICVRQGDVVSLRPLDLERKAFLENVVDKRLKLGIKVPEWLELDKGNRLGTILRLPVRSDVSSTIEEQLIVEFYSK